MTMPTSFPRAFPEVRFPAEFSALYDAPLKYIDEGVAHSHGYGIGPPFDGITDNTLYHKNKYEDMLKQVKEKARSEQRRRIYQTTGQAQIAYQNTVAEKRGAGMGSSPPFASGTIEGAPVLAGRGLRGGVMRTQAGQQYLEAALRRREADFNTIDLARVGMLEQNPQVLPREQSESMSLVEDLGDQLDSIRDAVATGTYDGDLVAAANEFLKLLRAVGYRIPQNLITQILRETEQLVSELASTFSIKGVMGVNPLQKRYARNAGTQLLRAVEVLKSLSAVSNLSMEERRLALGAYKPRGRLLTQAQLLAAQQARQPSRAGPEERGPAIPATVSSATGRRRLLPSEVFLPGPVETKVTRQGVRRVPLVPGSPPLVPFGPGYGTRYGELSQR